MNRQKLHYLERQALPTSLPTLVRLAQARKRMGWRYQQKTVEEWLQETAKLLKPVTHTYDFETLAQTFEVIGVGAIPVLIDALSLSDRSLRMGAIMLLGVFGPDARVALPFLASALRDPSARVRREIVKTMLLIKDLPSFILPYMLRILRDKDREVVALAVRAIACFGSAAEAALPILLKELKHDFYLIRSGSAYALGKLGFATPDVLQALDELIVHDPQTRSVAVRALFRLAPELVGEKLLHSSYPFEETLLALVPLRHEAISLLSPLYKLYTHYPAHPALLILLSSLGHHVTDFLPLLFESYREEMTSFNAGRRHEPQPLKGKQAGVIHILHTLRGIAIESYREKSGHDSYNAQDEMRQAIERIQQHGLSRKQHHLLSLRKRQHLEEYMVLQKRVELGDLAAKRLELAAYLGYRPAMTALQRKFSVNQDRMSLSALMSWAANLPGYGREVCARIGHAIARSVLPFWEEEYGDDPAPRLAVVALEDWLSTRMSVSDEYVESQGTFTPSPWCSPSSFAAGWAIKHATCLPRSPDGIANVLAYAVRAWMNVDGELSTFGNIRPELPLHQKYAVEHVRKAIRDLLIPWVLERYDPVWDACHAFGIE